MSSRRSLVVTLSTVLMVLAAPSPEAHASSCGAINDADERALCRARSSGRTSDCGAIRDADKRAYCRAVVGGSSSQCGSIRDPDLRNRCRAEADR